MSDEPLHRTLSRQLRRLGLDPGTPPDEATWHALLTRVSASYADDDGDRYTLERAIEISSSEMRALYDDLAEREQFQAALVEGAAEGVITFDSDGVVMTSNAAAARIFGRPRDGVVGSLLFELIPERAQRPECVSLAGDVAAGAAAVLGRSLELNGLRPSGDVFPLQVAVSEVRVGERVSFAAIIRDVSELKKLEETLHRQATRDTLTGLPNRASLLLALDEALTRTTGDDALVGVLFIDLDRFKVVNDSLGHQAGDELLIEAAARIRAAARERDLVARIGGDEFVVMCPDQRDDQGLQRVAESIQRRLGEAFRVGESDAFVSCSIGIALTSGEESADSLLRSADLAMYRAKKAGKNRTTVFDSKMQDWADRRLALEMELRRGIANGAIDVHYQPLVDLEREVVTGVEALVRWVHPERGLKLPAEFLPLAEETGLIVEIGAQVVERALRDAAGWMKLASRSTFETFGVGVNLSARQLQHPDLVARLDAALARHGLPADLLVVELTESTLIADDLTVRRALQELRGLGVQIAIDDFGTGFSSLAYLRSVPADYLKVDRSFIADVDHDPTAAAIVGAVLAMAHAVNLSTVVEGIERPRQLTTVRKLGATLGQGFLLGRPTSAEHLTELVQQSYGTLGHADSGDGRFTKTA
ncbi:MAG: EAL domain-containing protein [Gaiellales bacterium]